MSAFPAENFLSIRSTILRFSGEISVKIFNWMVRLWDRCSTASKTPAKSSWIKPDPDVKTRVSFLASSIMFSILRCIFFFPVMMENFATEYSDSGALTVRHAVKRASFCSLRLVTSLFLVSINVSNNLSNGTTVKRVGLSRVASMNPFSWSFLNVR